MYRSILIVAGLAMMVPPATASDRTINAGSQAGGLSSLRITELDIRERKGAPDSQRYPPPTTWETDQLVRWGAVGECVAARDHDASIAYVTAKRGSADAAAATRRLDPVFAACLAGSRVVAPGNQDYRRAALTDALGAPRGK